MSELVDMVIEMRAGHIEIALELCVTMVIAENMVDLMTQIIHALSEFGYLLDLTHSLWPTWNALIADVHHLLSKNSIRERKIYGIVVRICLLHTQLQSNDEKQIKQMHHQRLRREIINSFPSTASLSEAGKKTFAPLLPNDEQLARFMNVVLAGLTRLWTENDSPNRKLSKLALEYFSRKKLAVPIKEESDSKRTDLMWSLWKALMLFQKDHNNQSILNRYDLFCWNYSTAQKSQRLGLLIAGLNAIDAIDSTEDASLKKKMLKEEREFIDTYVDWALEVAMQFRKESVDVVQDAMKFVPKVAAAQSSQVQSVQEKVETKIIVMNR